MSSVNLTPRCRSIPTTGRALITPQPAANVLPGCGLVVRTMQGRALKVEGNKLHPVNLGKTCSRGQATLQGLYNPDRMQNPVKQNGRGSKKFLGSDLGRSCCSVSVALKDNKPDEIAFLMGLAPDHLLDLVTQLTAALGADAPLEYGALWHV